MAHPNVPKPSSRTFASIVISTAANGASEVVDLTGLTLSAIQMSTAWTSARIGFNVSVDGSTNYYPVHDTAGNPLTFPTSANRVVTFDPAVFSGVQRLQVVSETSAGVAVAQAAARTLLLGLSEYVGAD
ncbi:hypothetical protein ACUTAF_19580 [Pseudomonas sp. SP16.1]|uniref:hypothetical protein n=1 Tax=Pseudomonas sp. SP16.1 TaxID=3458854 RepID=UPI004045F036